MQAIIGLLFIFALGFYTVNLFITKRLGEKIGLGFLLGSCIFSLLLFYLEKLGIKFTLINSWAILLISITILIFLNILKRRILIPKISLINFKENIFSSAFLLFITISSFISNLLSPVKDWDAITLFDYRARVFLDTGSSDFLSANSYFTLHNFYTTMMHYWFWLTGWFSPMIFYSLVFTSFLILAFFIFRRFLNSRLSSIFTIALAVSPHIYENVFISYTNLSFSIFLVLGAIYMYLWSKKQNTSDLVLGIFFSLMTIWVRKVEPLWLANLSLIPYFLLFKQNNKLFKALSLAPLLLVAYYAKSHITVLINFDFRLLLQVFDFLNWSVFNFYFPFFIIPPIIFLYQLIHRKLDIEFLILTLASFLMIVLSSYGFASEMPGYWSGIPDTFRRLTLYWPLLMVLLVTRNSSNLDT